MAEWETRLSWHTTFSADSVEWCPIQPHTNMLVCGTYQLSEDTQDYSNMQQRVGRIYLFIVDGDTKTLEPIQTIDTTGILDLKWCYNKINDHAVLAAVTSDGKIQLYRLIQYQHALELNLWIEESIGTDVVVLSVDWSTNKIESNTPRLVVSDSKGSVTAWSLDDGGLTKVGDWKAHDFEAWTTAFDYWNCNIFYSGGDDCVLKGFDIRVAPKSVAANYTHVAGVTAIRNHTDVEHQLLTGCYDEKLRLWDSRNLKQAIREDKLSGGVWRLKWHPAKVDTVLAACMHGGFSIAKLIDQQFRVVGEYKDHASIAYGADWKLDSDSTLIATCSFYDCKMNISKCNL